MGSEDVSLLPKLLLTAGQENSKSDIPYYSYFHYTELILPILMHKNMPSNGESFMLLIARNIIVEIVLFQ